MENAYQILAGKLKLRGQSGDHGRRIILICTLKKQNA
jgi:hypothetical protein